MGSTFGLQKAGGHGDGIYETHVLRCGLFGSIDINYVLLGSHRGGLTAAFTLVE